MIIYYKNGDLMNKSIKYGLIIIIFAYLGLYFSYKSGYYVNKNTKKMILTEEKIKEYEQELKKGVDVTKKEYIEEENNYDNKYTNFTLKISKKIENGFIKIIKYIFNRIGNEINEKNNKNN